MAMSEEELSKEERISIFIAFCVGFCAISDFFTTETWTLVKDDSIEVAICCAKACAACESTHCTFMTSGVTSLRRSFFVASSEQTCRTADFLETRGGRTMICLYRPTIETTKN